MAAASVALALLAGFDRSIDYQWSASRLIAFQPWFLLGYYFRKEEGLRARWEGTGRAVRGCALGPGGSRLGSAGASSVPMRGDREDDAGCLRV